MLSLRDVSEILSQRGIIITYETIRKWGNKFGPLFAAEIKRRSPRRGDKWYMDEVCIVIKGIKFWLWRAVDQEGYELDIVLQSKRNKRAENSHQPTRQQEKKMRKFKSPKQVQQFLSRHGPIYNLFSVAVGRYKETAKNYRNKLFNAFEIWKEITLQLNCVQN